MSLAIHHETNVVDHYLTAYKSKWGWHSLPYQTYIKLKQLNKWAFQAYKKHCDYFKWTNKTINQTKNSPEIDPKFTILIHDKSVLEKFHQDWNIPFFFGSMVHYLKNEKEENERYGIYKNGYDHSPRFGISPIIPQIIDSYYLCKMPVQDINELEKTPLSIKDVELLHEKILG